MRKSLILLCAMICAGAINLSAQTKVIAHRGYWNTAGAAQNSIASLLNANTINCYGSEFDVWMTADGNLIVNHDDTYKGKKMERATAKQISNFKLSNGEQMPTLQQYLEAGKSTNAKLILELKSLSTSVLETEAVEKIIAMVSSLGLNDQMEYISFSRHAVEEFIRLAPQGTPVYYLEGDLSPKELKAMGCTGLDYHIDVFRRNPQWIGEARRLGLKVNVWTVNSLKDMGWCIAYGVDFITTDEPVMLQGLLEKN